jgi:KDO2-lipid IV(A) lauroyltransferase
LTHTRHLLSRPGFYRLGFAGAGLFPRSVLYRVADGIGEASYLAYGEAARIVGANLRRVFPDLSDREIARMARKTFRNFARYLVDYGRFRALPPEKAGRVLADLEGKEYMDAAFRDGRGVILVTGHIGNWELGGIFFGQRGVKINVATFPEGSARIDAIRERYRSAHRIHTILLDGSPFAPLEMMAALRRGEIVAMLVDRWGKEEGVEAEFFGASRFFPEGPFALSRATGAWILPAFVVRQGEHYQGIAEEPFVVEGEDTAPYARKMAEALERVIRRYPDQWYNFLPA